MTEVIFYPSLISNKNKLENLEKIEDKSNDNLIKIFYPYAYECKCKKNVYGFRFIMNLKKNKNINILLYS